jgi:hypothetical protein
MKMDTNNRCRSHNPLLAQPSNGGLVAFSPNNYCHGSQPRTLFRAECITTLKVSKILARGCPSLRGLPRVPIPLNPSLSRAARRAKRVSPRCWTKQSALSSCRHTALRKVPPNQSESHQNTVKHTGSNQGGISPVKNSPLKKRFALSR